MGGDGRRGLLCPISSFCFALCLVRFFSWTCCWRGTERGEREGASCSVLFFVLVFAMKRRKNDHKKSKRCSRAAHRLKLLPRSHSQSQREASPSPPRPGILATPLTSAPRAGRKPRGSRDSWLSKDPNITTVNSATDAIAALTSSPSSSSSSSSSSASALVVVAADLTNKNLRSFRLDDLAGVTSADLAGNEELDLIIVDSCPALSLPKSLPAGPKFSISSLRSLGLSRCKLTAVPTGLAKACPNLSDLDLSHNELKGAFEAKRGDLPKSLLRLNAQGNRGLTSVDNGTLASLPNLVLLGLKSCSLESLPGPALGKLTRLRELYITDNKIKNLPREIGRCASLVKLQASFNLLETLPVAELAKLPKLEMVRAAACRISSLPGLDELLVSSKGNERAFRSLCWLSLAGNPLFDSCAPPPRAEAARVFDLDEVLNIGSKGEELGSGASGDVVAVRFDATSAARSGGGKTSKSSKTVPPTLAFKRFRADAGPDGRAIDEISVARAVSHGALASTVGTVVAAVEGKSGKGKSKGGAASAVVASFDRPPSFFFFPRRLASLCPLGPPPRAHRGEAARGEAQGRPAAALHLACCSLGPFAPVVGVVGPGLDFDLTFKLDSDNFEGAPLPRKRPRRRGAPRLCSRAPPRRPGMRARGLLCSQRALRIRNWTGDAGRLWRCLLLPKRGRQTARRRKVILVPRFSRPSSRGRSGSSCASSPSTGSKKREKKEEKEKGGRKAGLVLSRKPERRSGARLRPRPTRLWARDRGSQPWRGSWRSPRGRSAVTRERSSSAFVEWFRVALTFYGVLSKEKKRGNAKTKKTKNFRGKNFHNLLPPPPSPPPLPLSLCSSPTAGSTLSAADLLS